MPLTVEGRVGNHCPVSLPLRIVCLLSHDMAAAISERDSSRVSAALTFSSSRVSRMTEVWVEGWKGSTPRKAANKCEQARMLEL